MDTIWNKFRKYVSKYQLILPDEVVILGVSGGKDSMFGFDLLNRLRNEIGFRLEAFMSFVPPHLYREEVAYNSCVSYVRSQDVHLHLLSADEDELEWKEESACDQCKAIRRMDVEKLIHASPGSVVAGCFTIDDLLHYAFSLLVVTHFRPGMTSISSAKTREQYNRRLMRFVPRASRPTGGFTIYPCLPFCSNEILDYLDKRRIPYGYGSCRWSRGNAGATRAQCQPPASKHYYVSMLRNEYSFELSFEDIRDMVWQWAQFSPRENLVWPDVSSH